MEEIAILTGLRRRDIKALGQLYHRYYLMLCQFAGKLVNNGTIAEDIASDSFVRYWQSGKTFSNFKELESYLFTIAKNLSIDYQRNTRDHLAFELWQAAELTEASIEAKLVNAETYRLILDFFRELPPGQRAFAELWIKDELSIGEIARRLNTTSQNISNQKKELLKKLRKMLREKYFSTRRLHFFHFPVIGIDAVTLSYYSNSNISSA